MPGEEPEAQDPKVAELIELARQIRERVRQRYPQAGGDEIAIPDLMPLLHARDAALGKVAAIGTVNPRPPGLINNLIQLVKRLIARLLDWHVREQIEFNRSVIDALNALLEALNENNRALLRLAQSAAQGREAAAQWNQLMPEWQQRLETGEIRLLRTIADLQALYDRRIADLEVRLRDLASRQHQDFKTALDQATVDIQRRLWDDLARLRTELDRQIHAELRILRQRLQLLEYPAASGCARSIALSPTVSCPPDGLAFCHRFRGPEDYVRERQRFYVPFFQDSGPVLDLGCGRGEFLELLRELGIPASGIDSSPENVRLCQAKGLDVRLAHAMDYLSGLEEGTLGGVFCCHVLEHLAPETVLPLLRLIASRLMPGGLLAIETPNPECLATLSRYFFQDPTHRFLLPPSLVRFYLEEAGFGAIQLHYLSPAHEHFPSLMSLPPDFARDFFGFLDYAVLARKI